MFIVILLIKLFFFEENMQEISSEKLLEIVQSRSNIVKTQINNVSTDSRNVTLGTLFVAIQGENLDGHNFAKQALEKGAELVLVNRYLPNVPVNRQIVVQDTLKAFAQLGAYNRSLFKGKVIGLTGSAGKTTTKEEIKFVLSHYGKVYATEGNHNNHIGVPISLCEMDMNADYAVIEMGMSAKGEILFLTSLVKPDIALVTNVYPMHIEFFDNFEGIAEAKAEIFEGLPVSGIAVINEDTNFADVLEKKASEHCAKIIKFGHQHHYQGKIVLQQEGEIQLYNAWATLAVVEALGLQTEIAAFVLKDFGMLPGRGKHYQLKLPRGGAFTLIDDSYSGQPEAMKFAINGLDKIETSGRKIALLGKMAELGNTSNSRHEEIGKFLADSSIDIVIGVCPEMKTALAQLRGNQQQYYFETKDGVAEFLINNLLQNNDILLIKGARYSSHLYEVAETLMKGLEKV